MSQTSNARMNLMHSWKKQTWTFMYWIVNNFEWSSSHKNNSKTLFSRETFLFSSAGQTPHFSVLLCVVIQAHDPSRSHHHVRAHVCVNSAVFIMLPPAGTHLETGATEDCSLSLNCVWNDFKSFDRFVTSASSEWMTSTMSPLSSC
jgi:hypothetical protein